MIWHFFFFIIIIWVITNKNTILDSELPTIHSTSLEEHVWYTPTETALTNCADA